MRGTDSLGNVINRVERMSAGHYDETIPAVDMEFDNLKSMWISGNPVEVLPSAQRLFANRLRVPYSYVNRCPEHLQRENLNHWLREEAKERDTLFCRFDGDRLRAVFTERYTVLNHMDILNRMVGCGFDLDREVHFNLDENLMVVKVPDPTKAFKINGEDPIIPGIGLANSEVGVLAFSIEAYFYRLICSNGLIAKTGVSSKFRHISLKGLEEFPEIMQQVVYETEQSQGRFRLSLESPVENPTASIASFNRQFQVCKNAAEAVEWGYDQEPGFSMFHIIQAYTRAAQAPGLSAEESYHLERVGGMVMSMVKS